eukprot:Filipodium_phascolosomae@DN3383_c0_g1_i1.p1
MPQLESMAESQEELLKMALHTMTEGPPGTKANPNPPALRGRTKNATQSDPKLTKARLEEKQRNKEEDIKMCEAFTRLMNLDTKTTPEAAEADPEGAKTAEQMKEDIRRMILDSPPSPVFPDANLETSKSMEQLSEELLDLLAKQHLARRRQREFVERWKTDDLEHYEESHLEACLKAAAAGIAIHKGMGHLLTPKELEFVKSIRNYTSMVLDTVPIPTEPESLHEAKSTTTTPREETERAVLKKNSSCETLHCHPRYTIFPDGSHCFGCFYDEWNANRQLRLNDDIWVNLTSMTVDLMMFFPKDALHAY